MANRPTATVVKLVTGNPGHRPLPEGEPVPDGKPEKPPKMKGRASKIWDQFIARAFWLTWADAPKAYAWCCLQAEFEDDPEKMTASRITQLRIYGSDLGFDPAARARLGAKRQDGEKKDPAAKYFD